MPTQKNYNDNQNTKEAYQNAKYPPILIYAVLYQNVYQNDRYQGWLKVT